MTYFSLHICPFVTSVLSERRLPVTSLPSSQLPCLHHSPVLLPLLSCPVLLFFVRGHRGLSRSAAGRSTHDWCAHPAGIGPRRSRLLCVVFTPVRRRPRHDKNQHCAAQHYTTPYCSRTVYPPFSASAKEQQLKSERNCEIDIEIEIDLDNDIETNVI
jgi:hypothetical protein